MDEARRAELHARRTAILAEAATRDHARRRAEFVAMVPILTALEDAGDAYESDSYRGVRGVFNAWAHDPHLYGMREESHAALPLDPLACEAVILASLRERLGDDDLVTVILRIERMVLTLRMPVLLRHFQTLLDNAMGDRLAFAAPPADWIIDVYRSEAIPASEIAIGTLVAG